MIHFLINGFPFYFSDTASPLSGATATLKPWIVGGAELVRAIRYQIEPWGGCVKSSEINVTLADADLALSRLLPIYPDPAPVRCLEYMITPVLSGKVLVDVSDNSDLSIGDILQCPYDAWEITAVGPAELPTGINCDRGIYSCFPGSTWIYQPYYQRGSGQSELFSFGRGVVPEIDGRTCTLWIDGQLAWIGVVSAPLQQGPRWTFRCRHILDAWQDKFKPEGLPSFHLNHDAYNGGGRWWQGALVAPDSSGGIPAEGPIPAPYYPQEYGWTTDDRRGLSFLGTGEPTVAETLQNRATLAALGDSVAYDSGIGRYVTQPGGTRMYGWIDDPLMPVGILGALNADLVGQWLDCPDGLAESVRKQIAAVSVANGTITLDQFTTTKDGEWITGRAGFSSPGPISFRAAPVVSAPSMPILFYALLTSTGSGDNGDHDLFPGYLGLGLPAELVDDRISYLLHDAGGVTAADLGEANLSEELEAAGCWLVWRDGQFAIQEVSAPTTQASDVTLDGDLLATDAAPEVDRAAVAPVLCVTYEDAKGNKLTLNVRTPQIYRPTAGASKELRSKIRVGLPDASLSGNLASIAYWLSRYAPRMTVPLIPGHGLALGQVVTLESPFLAGAGDAYGASVAALVIGVSEVDADLLLNTQPAPERILAPALRVLEWTGAVLTVAGGALEWLNLAGLDGNLRLHDETDGTYETVVIVSVDSDTQITIDAAPGLTAGDSVVLTIPTYAGIVANQTRYCFLADAGKTLDGDPAHEYVF